MMEITSEEQNIVKRMKRTEDSLTDLWDSIKCTNIRIIGFPEEEEKKKVYEKIFEEIIVENFHNVEKDIVNQVQEAQGVPYRINPRRNTPRYTVIKLTKIKHKEKILKAAAASTAAKSLHSCPTLCNPIDSSPPGSPVPGILPARTLEWVANSFSNT